MVSNARLRANLPFPGKSARRASRSARVRSSSPLARKPSGGRRGHPPDRHRRNRALEVIARIDNPGPLKGGGLGRCRRRHRLRERSRGGAGTGGRYCARPARSFTIADGKARQQIVESAANSAGLIEITSGLQGGKRSPSTAPAS